MTMPDIPDCLRRDANNKAPFMDVQMRAYEAAKLYAANEIILRDLETSPPTSPPDLCIDEGCPQHGTPHICVNPATNLPVSPPNWVPPWKTTT